MAPNPVIFALANPDPEISYEDAKAERPDAIVATGRSDYPNQVNNVLGFPFIFRGALDVRATQINEEMKIAAARALAELAREDVPEAVAKAYGLESLHFGPDYLIPKPVDPRVLLWVAPAVAGAAMETGAARLQVDLDLYREQLESRLGKSREMMRIVFNKARANPRRVVLAEGAHEKMIRAAHQLVEEGLAMPVLLGDEAAIRARAAELDLDLDGVTLENPATSPRRERYIQRIYELRSRRGVTMTEAREPGQRPQLLRRRDGGGGRRRRDALGRRVPLPRQPAPAAADHPHRTRLPHRRGRVHGHHAQPRALLRRLHRERGDGLREAG